MKYFLITSALFLNSCWFNDLSSQFCQEDNLDQSTFYYAVIQHDSSAHSFGPQKHQVLTYTSMELTDSGQMQRLRVNFYSGQNSFRNNVLINHKIDTVFQMEWFIDQRNRELITHQALTYQACVDSLERFLDDGGRQPFCLALKDSSLRIPYQLLQKDTLYHSYFNGKDENGCHRATPSSVLSIQYSDELSLDLIVDSMKYPIKN